MIDNKVVLITDENEKIDHADISNRNLEGNNEYSTKMISNAIKSICKEFEIYTDTNITIEQDLARRDITINAIAKDVLTQQIIDPYNGKQDLREKIIRATTEHFKEDPLRVYRVARFAAQLEFEVEKNTIAMMKQLKSELNSLSSERVFAEFRKALNTEKPSIFFHHFYPFYFLEAHRGLPSFFSVSG